MSEETSTESLHEYCLQLGLQVRGTSEAQDENVAASAASLEDLLKSDATSGETAPKDGYDCKNCNKAFSNSRQFTKHRCCATNYSSGGKVTDESPPKTSPQMAKDSKVKTKSPRKRRGKVGGGTDDPGKVDEACAPDHTYNKEGEEIASGGKTKCDICSLIPESDDHGEVTQCERCQELAVKESNESKKQECSSPKKRKKYEHRQPGEICPHCQKVFHSGKRLEKHVKICGKNLICEFCGKDFNEVTHNAYVKYEDHYYTHVKEKPFQCSHCDQGFVRKPDFDKHSLIHTTTYEAKTCPKCDVVFSTVKQLTKHMKKHEQPSWTCATCEKEFVRQVLYDKHILNCRKNVSCEICGKVFNCIPKNLKYRYQEHMFTHTGERPYKCQFCEQAFRDRSTRRKHERTHTNEKPYPCTICGRAFSQLRLLRIHVRIHTGEKPYGCQVCRLRFAKQCNLIYHMRVHTKEKPYACEVCNKTFTQSGTYHKHMRRHQSRGECTEYTTPKAPNTTVVTKTAITNCEEQNSAPSTIPSHVTTTDATTSEGNMVLGNESTMSDSVNIPNEASSQNTMDPEMTLITIRTELPIPRGFTMPTIPQITETVPVGQIPVQVAMGNGVTAVDHNVISNEITIENEVTMENEDAVAIESLESEHVISDIPLDNQEITIVVSEGNIDHNTDGFVTTEVELSNIIASCSQ